MINKHNTVPGGTVLYWFFLCIYICRAMQTNHLCSFNQILISNPTSLWNDKSIHMSSSEILKTKKRFYLAKLSYPLKGFNNLQDFLRFSLSNRAQRSSDTVPVVPKAYVLKLSIFVAQRLAINQNGVEFRQLSIGDIRISLDTSYDVVRRRAVLLKNWLTTNSRTHILTHKVTYGGRHAA